MRFNSSYQFGLSDGCCHLEGGGLRGSLCSNCKVVKRKGYASWFGHLIVDTVELEGCPVTFGRGKFSVPELDSVPSWYKIREAHYPQGAIDIS